MATISNKEFFFKHIQNILDDLSILKKVGGKGASSKKAYKTYPKNHCRDDIFICRSATSILCNAINIFWATTEKFRIGSKGASDRLAEIYIANCSDNLDKSENTRKMISDAIFTLKQIRNNNSHLYNFWKELDKDGAKRKPIILGAEKDYKTGKYTISTYYKLDDYIGKNLTLEYESCVSAVNAIFSLAEVIFKDS